MSAWHAHGRVEPVPDRGLVAQVRLENQAERLTRAGHEVENAWNVALTRCLLSVVEASESRMVPVSAWTLSSSNAMVQVELAREVLVQHGLADPGPLGDLVHRRRVVALRDEDFPGRAQ